jgi:hypothetical protein
MNDETKLAKCPDCNYAIVALMEILTSKKIKNLDKKIGTVCLSCNRIWKVTER